jgi:uncharacterized phiE125 gp8 family phage protein
MLYPQRPVLTVPPAELPVSLQDAKDQLRVSTSAEDDLIGSFIAAATSHLDGWTGTLGRCLVTQTWQQAWPGFPDQDVLRLPFPSVSSVEITYRDEAGVLRTLASSAWHLVEDALGGAVMLADGQVWPATATRPDAVLASMVCGYGAADDVPSAIKQAIRMLIGHFYEQREAMVTGVTATPVGFAVDALTAPFRRVI